MTSETLELRVKPTYQVYLGLSEPAVAVVHKSHMHQSSAIDSSPERSQPPESAAGQNQQDPAAGEASDSGDSLFITQKEIPSPVRTARRLRHGKGSGLTSSRWLEESDAESSSSSSQEESGSHTKTSRKKSSLPVYTFSVLADKECDGSLPSQKNRILNTFAVAGFFKCLSEFETKTSSPTVDADEEDISPLSEEEEEQPPAKGFRVVDKMCFVTALKARSRRSWCSQRNRQARRKAGCVGEEALRENGPEMEQSVAAEASTWTSAPLSELRGSSGDAGNSSKVLGENGNKPPHPPDVDGETQAEEMADTAGTLLHSSPLGHSHNESIRMDMRPKKSKKKKKNAQIHANVEGQREEEVTPPTPQSPGETESNKRSLHDDETDGREEKTSREHRTRKKRRTKAANIPCEEHVEPDVMITDSMISLQGGGKRERNRDDDVRQSERSSTTHGAPDDAEGRKPKRQKDKKDRKVISADEREESVKSFALVERSYPGSTGEGTDALEDGTPDSRRSAEDHSPPPAKKKKQRRGVKLDLSEDSVSQGGFSVAVQEERRSTSSFPCADAVEKEVQTGRKHASVPADHSGTQSAETTENLEQSGCWVRKKKGKRKHNYKDDVFLAFEDKSSKTEANSSAGLPNEELVTYLELRKKRKEHTTAAPLTSEVSKSSISSPDRVVSKKHKKLKRKLYHPGEDLLE